MTVDHDCDPHISTGLDAYSEFLIFSVSVFFWFAYIVMSQVLSAFELKDYLV